MRHTIKVDIDLDDFTPAELIDALDSSLRNLSLSDIESLEDLIIYWYKDKKNIKTERDDNCLIINNINVFSIKTLPEVLKIQEFVETLKY